MKLRYKIVNGFLVVVAVAIAGLAFTLSYTSDCTPGSAVSGEVELMKAAVHRCYGPPEVVSIEDVEKPRLDADEVLVKVQAAAVNPLDWHTMRGSPYFMRLGSGIGAPDDIRLGVDFSGTVEAVGADVTRFKPGDEVFGGAGGAFAQYLTIREDRALALKPENVSFAEAASVAIAASTALQALRDQGGLRGGQKVLINGASGGVGTFAVQIAKHFGAEVTGVCSTRNVEMVRSIGADRVFDYTKENYTESDERYDLIVDMVGNHPILANKRVLKPGGSYVVVGGPKGNWFGPMMGALKSAIVSPFVDEQLGMMLAELRQDDLKTLGALMQSGEVVPVIDRHYGFNELPAAIEYSEQGRARGKIIIDMN